MTNTSERGKNMINFEITKDDVLTHIEDKLLEALDNKPYREIDGSYCGRDTKFSSLLNEITSKISENISNKLWAEERKTLQDKIQLKIDEQLMAILTTTYQPVNQWGECEGAQTTIKALFEKQVKDYWLQGVDNQGRPTTRDYGTKTTRAEFIAKSQIETAFLNTMKSEMETIIKSFRDVLAQTMKQQSSEMIEKSIQSLIRVS
jgi:hypothetical protein